MHNIKKFLLSCYYLLYAYCSYAAYPASNCQEKHFNNWKLCIAEHYKTIGPQNLDFRPIYEANYSEKTIELDTNQPEMKWDYTKYRNKINLSRKIKDAKKYLKENKTLLQQIENKYQVDKEVIVALLVMESNFGTVTGNFNMIDTLATLAYNGRRRHFFEQELWHFLHIHPTIPHKPILGSWAGAFGQCQFMPSSYRNFSVDTDNKGYADLWHNKMDLYSSIANYLQKNNWKKGDNLLKQIKTSKVNKYRKKKIAQLIYLPYNGFEYYIAGGNYKVLMHWNRSSYFAVSVLTIVNTLQKHRKIF